MRKEDNVIRMRVGVMATATETLRDKVALSEVWSHKPAAIVCAIIVKRNHDQGTLQKKAFNGGLLIASESESMIITVGTMAAGRQAWWWG